MAIQTIVPNLAKKLLDDGAVIVDIRSPNEYAGEHIPGALNIPVDQLETLESNEASKVIFYCRSGMRTKVNAAQIESATNGEIFIIQGGLLSWKKTNLPLYIGPKQPIELSRQVHIIAGTLIVLGILLGQTLSQWFYLLSLFVGAGLLFAGLTGFCGMALLLMKMPWNKTNKTI